MVICALRVDKDKLDELKALGVKDSKLLSPKRREELALEIRKLARGVKIFVLEAEEIDEMRAKMSLNQIELNIMAQLINESGDKEVFLDLPEPGKTWISILRKKISSDVKIVAEHKADVRYPIVGAASILAKVERDRRVRELEKQLGLEIGSGYPADPHTINFLRKWAAGHKEFPPWVRKSWRTAQRIWGIKKQKPLTAFRKKKQKRLIEF